MSNLPKPEDLVDPKQPTFIYDIHKAWEEVVQNEPIWLSGKFPEFPKEKKFKFLGFDLVSPIAISAGPASRKPWTDFYLKMGYGLVLEKTRRSTPRKSNIEPNITIIKSEKQLERDSLNEPLIGTLDESEWEKYKSITNSFGNPSPAIEVWADELKKQVKSVADGQVMGCSVTATALGSESSCSVILGDNAPAALIVETCEDMLIAAAAAVVTGAKIIEFNLACPNVLENTEEGEMFQSEQIVAYLFTEFKRRFPKVPAGFKFGLYKNKEQMRKVFKAGGEYLDYVSGINALPLPVVGKDGREILPGRNVSGVCGKILRNIALEHIKWADEIRREEGLKFEILGGGGIVELSDVDQFLNAGADMVQVATIALADPLFAYKYELSKSSSNS